MLCRYACTEKKDRKKIVKREWRKEKRSYNVSRWNDGAKLLLFVCCKARFKKCSWTQSRCEKSGKGKLYKLKSHRTWMIQNHSIGIDWMQICKGMLMTKLKEASVAFSVEVIYCQFNYFLTTTKISNTSWDLSPKIDNNPFFHLEKQKIELSHASTSSLHHHIPPAKYLL